jgi:hypothetical protein
MNVLAIWSTAKTALLILLITETCLHSGNAHHARVSLSTGVANAEETQWLIEGACPTAKDAPQSTHTAANAEIPTPA